jgi:hypothetical protein
MAKLDFTSQFLRSNGLVVDKHGVDPLLDKKVPDIAKITSYSLHVVTQDERGAPDLIAHKEYGDSSLWWYIMVYNGISSYRSIIQGLTLKIPELTSILATLSASSGSSTAGKSGLVKRTISL